MDRGGFSSGEATAACGSRETPYLLVPIKRIPSTWSACSSAEQAQEDDAQVKGQSTKLVTLEDFLFDPARRSTTQSVARSSVHPPRDLNSWEAILRRRSAPGLSVCSRARKPCSPVLESQDAARSPVRTENQEGAAPEDATRRSEHHPHCPASAITNNREQGAQENESDAQICEADDNGPRASCGHRGDPAGTGSHMRDGNIVHHATEGTRTHGDGEASAEVLSKRHSGVLKASKDGACNTGEGTNATNVDGAGTRLPACEYSICVSSHSEVVDDIARGAAIPGVPGTDHPTSAPPEACVAHDHQDHVSNAVEHKTEVATRENHKILLSFHERHSDVMAEVLALRQRPGLRAGAFRRRCTYDPSDFVKGDDNAEEAEPSIPAVHVRPQNTIGTPEVPGAARAQLDTGGDTHVEGDQDLCYVKKRGSVESADTCEVHKMGSTSSVDSHQRQAALLHWKASVASVMSRSSRSSTVSSTMRGSVDSVVATPSFSRLHQNKNSAFPAITSRFRSVDMNDFVGSDFIGSYSSTALHDTTQSRVDQSSMVANDATDTNRGRFSKQSDVDSRVGFIETINEGRFTMDKEYCSYGSSDCSVDCRPREGRAYGRSSSSILGVPRGSDANQSWTSDVVSNRTPSFQMDFTHDLSSGSVPMLESCRELIRATRSSRFLMRKPESCAVSVASTSKFGNASSSHSAQSYIDPAFPDWQASLEESVQELQALLIHFLDKQSSRSVEPGVNAVLESIFAHAEHLTAKIHNFPYSCQGTPTADNVGRRQTTNIVNEGAINACAEKMEEYRSEDVRIRENANHEVAQLKQELEEVRNRARLVAQQHERELRAANERLVGNIDSNDAEHVQAKGRGEVSAALSDELSELRAIIAGQQERLENEELRIAAQEQQLIEKQLRIDNFEATARELRFEVKLRKNVETQLKRLHESDVASLQEAITTLKQDMSAKIQQGELDYGTIDESEDKAAIRELELEVARLNMQLVAAKSEARTAARKRDNAEMTNASEMEELRGHMDQTRTCQKEQPCALKLEAEDKMEKKENDEASGAHNVESHGGDRVEPARRVDDVSAAPADSALCHLHALNAQLNEENARLQREVALCTKHIATLTSTIADLGDAEGKQHACTEDVRSDITVKQNTILAEITNMHSERQRALEDTRTALSQQHRASVRFHDLETMHKEMKAEWHLHGDSAESESNTADLEAWMPVASAKHVAVTESCITTNDGEKESSATQKEVPEERRATQEDVEEECNTPQKNVEEEWSGRQKETSETSSEEAALKARFEELLMICERQHRDIDLLCLASRRKVALQSVSVGTKTRRSNARLSTTSGEGSLKTSSEPSRASPGASGAKTAKSAQSEDKCDAQRKAVAGGAVEGLGASGPRVRRSASSRVLDQRSDEVVLWAQHFVETRDDSERMRQLLNDTCASVEELLDVVEKAFAGRTTKNDVAQLCQRVSRRVPERVEEEDGKENTKPRDRTSSLALIDSQDIHAIRSRWLQDAEKRKVKFAQQKARAMSICETLENQVLAFVKERMDRRQAEGALGAKISETWAQNSQISRENGEPLNSFVVKKATPNHMRCLSLPTRPLRVSPPEVVQTEQGPNLASVSSLHSRLVNLRAALKPTSTPH